MVEYANFLTDQGKNKEAETQYHKALELNPNLKPALAGLEKLGKTK